MKKEDLQRIEKFMYQYKLEKDVGKMYDYYTLFILPHLVSKVKNLNEETETKPLTDGNYCKKCGALRYSCFCTE